VQPEQQFGEQDIVGGNRVLGERVDQDQSDAETNA